VVTLSTSSLTFGTQLVGTHSAGQAVTLTNAGAITLNISSIVASGDFLQQNDCGSVLPAGASCKITVVFAPAGKGVRSGAVNIADDAVNSPQTIALTGTGTVVALSLTSVDFGDQKVGTSSQPQPITIVNVGTDPIQVSAVGIAGMNFGDFALKTTCGSKLPGGASCTFGLIFTPKATGSRHAHLDIADSGGGSPQKVKLTGNGI
jgi:Abnormal spindle-like microcephaly-assoc'd, ASPM-SPD-2-Hydin